MSHNHWDHNWEKDIKPDYHPELIKIIEKHAKGKRVLELGFGTGGDLITLAKKGYICFGIEASTVAYEHSINKFPKRIKTVFGNAEKLPWETNSFDIIYHQGVLEHFKKPERFLEEQVRVLSSKGILVIDVPHKWNIYTIYKNLLYFGGRWYGGWERSFSDKELREIVKDYNLIPIKTYYRGIYPHRWGKFLFPEKIIRRRWAMKLLKTPPVSWTHSLARRLYDKSKLIQVVSSYNIIIVLKKK